MKYTTLLLVLGAGVLLAAPAYGQDPADIGKGARIWADNCARCHNARSPMEHGDRAWSTIVAHMRARANLTRTEARLVTTYLRAMNAPATMADVGRQGLKTGSPSELAVDGELDRITRPTPRLSSNTIGEMLAFLRSEEP